MFDTLERHQYAMEEVDVEAQHPSHEPKVTPKPARAEAGRSSTAFLDGLRGLAALCVFNQHLLGLVGQNHGFGENGHYELMYLPFIRIFYSGGGAAVNVFFVLSGFVLSQGPLNRLQQRAKCRAYLVSAAVRRPFRLYLPCIVASLLVVILMQLPYGILPKLNYLPSEGSFLLDLLKLAKTFVRFVKPFPWGTNYFNNFYPYNRSLWTIPIEMKGSVLVYGIFAVLTYVPLSALFVESFLAALTILLLHKACWWEGCFVAGIVIAILHSDSSNHLDALRNLPRWTISCVAYGTFGIGYYLLCQPFQDGNPAVSRESLGWHFLSNQIPSAYTDEIHMRCWLSYGAILTVTALLHMPKAQKLLCTRPMQHLGRVSFMLYVIHESLFILVVDRWKRLIGHVGFMGADPKWWDDLFYIPEWGVEGMNLRLAVEWGVASAMALFVAHWATKYVDEPCLRLSKWLADHIVLVGGFAIGIVERPCTRLVPVARPALRLFSRLFREPGGWIAGKAARGFGSMRR